MPELYSFLDVEVIVGAEDEEELDDKEEDFCEFLNNDELVLDDETETAFIWSVRVKLGQEDNVIFQICRQCLEPSEIHPPAITSAFARPSIPGYVFIEVFDVEAAVHAVKGFVTIGQWVRCLAGQYRDDVGYVYKTDISSQWSVLVAFVPQIPQSGGKRKRDGRPAPHVWTAAELIQQYGNGKVKVLGSNKFVFGGSTYEDGLVMEHVPLSYLHALEHSPQNITPFMQSNMIRSHSPFHPCLKHFAQDSTQVGDRILVVSGEHTGIIGRTETIQDHITDMVVESPEQHSGLIIHVTLHNLIPHFLPGDNVKDRWSDSFGMVTTIDHNGQKVAFLDREASAEINTSTLNIQFFHSPLRFFQFTLGLYVEFPGAGGTTHRGRISQVPDDCVAKVMDEISGQHLDVNAGDIIVSGVQAVALPTTKHRHIWEGKQIVITRGSFKGYHGLVKTEDLHSVDVELDAKVSSHGQARQRFQFGEFQLKPIAIPVASSSRLNRTPPPEDIPHTLTPDPEEPDGSTVYPQSSWLFAEEIQGVLREECIPFRIRGIPALSPHAGLNGLTAKTVPVTSQKILPEPKEVIVSVVQKKRPTQISIEPSYLKPWIPSEGNKVLIIGNGWIGQVGKLILLERGSCTIKLESSGEYVSAAVEDVVNVLRR
ncbi:hypothetical protein EI94DRAFT_1879950 [Lactarius quietus]|nr:hypothetical protein EI94DRAFT_1879950 [Lactarius quietus]